MGLFCKAGAVISKDQDILDYECQTGGNQNLQIE